MFVTILFRSGATPSILQNHELEIRLTYKNNHVTTCCVKM